MGRVSSASCRASWWSSQKGRTLAWRRRCLASATSSIISPHLQIRKHIPPSPRGRRSPSRDAHVSPSPSHHNPAQTLSPPRLPSSLPKAGATAHQPSISHQRRNWPRSIPAHKKSADFWCQLKPAQASSSTICIFHRICGPSEWAQNAPMTTASPGTCSPWHQHSFRPGIRAFCGNRADRQGVHPHIPRNLKPTKT